MARKWPVDKDLITSRKGIMAWLKIENWDSVQKLISKEGLPVARIGGRWCGKRENLERWLDDRTGAKVDGVTRDDLDGLLEIVKRFDKLLPQGVPNNLRGRRTARLRAAKIRRFYKLHQIT